MRIMLKRGKEKPQQGDCCGLFSFGQIPDKVFPGRCADPDQGKEKEECDDQNHNPFDSVHNGFSCAWISTSVLLPEAGF